MRLIRPPITYDPWISLAVEDDEHRPLGQRIGNSRADRRVCFVATHPGKDGPIDELILDEEDRANIRAILTLPAAYRLLERFALNSMSSAQVMEEAATLLVEAGWKHRWYENFYYCRACDAEWSDRWNCMCNDRCPNCNAEIEPYRSEDVEPTEHELKQIE